MGAHRGSRGLGEADDPTCAQDGTLAVTSWPRISKRKPAKKWRYGPSFDGSDETCPSCATQPWEASQEAPPD